MIKSYRKKPLVIDAIEWTGANLDAVKEFCGNAFRGHVAERHIGGKSEIAIGTLEDGELSQVKHIASKGDFIIKGIKGEFYPCKPNIFKQTYEMVVGEKK